MLPLTRPLISNPDLDIGVNLDLLGHHQSCPLKERMLSRQMTFDVQHTLRADLNNPSRQKIPDKNLRVGFLLRRLAKCY